MKMCAKFSASERYQKWHIRYFCRMSLFLIAGHIFIIQFKEGEICRSVTCDVVYITVSVLQFICDNIVKCVKLMKSLRKIINAYFIYSVKLRKN